MHVNKTRAMAQTAMMSALTMLLLLVGTFISVNTLFFTALASYLVGYSINKYGIRYGGMQLVVCALLDIFLNPNKLHWVLYLCFGSYIFLSELIFCKWNKIGIIEKKIKVQLIYNWILFNIIYIPLLVFGRQLLYAGEQIGGVWVLWVLGQAGWIIYDKAYRVFFRTIRERKL